MSGGDRIGQARAHVDVRWTDERAARVLAGVPARAKRQRRRRVVAVAALLVVGGLAVARLRPAAQLPTRTAWHLPDRVRHPSGATSTMPHWRTLADRGEWLRAWNELRQSELRDEPGELLAAAEVARKSGHPHDALSPLALLLDQHGRDARAAQAAFALGGVLLDDLDRPRDAARAFAEARTLPGHAGFDEDALAREAEAWLRAGDEARATARIREYLRRWPDSDRLGSVRQARP